MINISSKSNELYKFLKNLKLKKYRDKEKLFIAEGEKFLQYNYNVKYYILKKDFLDNYKNVNFLNSEKCIILSDDLFKEITSQEKSQGLIIVYNYIENDLSKFKKTLIVIDKIQDPGNLGTIIRTADAAGINDFIFIKGTVDIYNEKTVRATMGSLFSINYTYMEEEEAIEYLKKNEYNIIVTALTDKSIDYKNMIIKNKNAIIFGNEGNGVSEILQKKSDCIIKIPITGNAESLNVSVAAGITLYKYSEIYNKN